MFYIPSSGMLTFVMHFATVSNHFDWVIYLGQFGVTLHRQVFFSFLQLLSSPLHFLHFHVNRLIIVVHGDLAVKHQCLSETYFLYLL